VEFASSTSFRSTYTKYPDLYCPDFSGLAQIFTPIWNKKFWNKEPIDQTIRFVMASFLNSTISQVSHVAQAGSLGEIRVGRRTVQIKGKLAEGVQRLAQYAVTAVL
jgi:hypothetical protein